MLRIALIALLVLSAPASAATVQVKSIRVGHDKYASTQRVLDIAGDPGEASELTVGFDAGGGYVVSDARSPLRAGAGCTASGELEVRCAGAVLSVDVALGDGADRLTIDPAARMLVGARGGEGDDVLVGGPWNDNFNGEGGDDRLEGGGGDDELFGGEGADTLLGGADADRAFPATGERAPARDVIDLGEGRDEITYIGRKAPMDVDLARGRAAEDAILGTVESFSGGGGKDVIRGTRGHESLAGGRIDDRAGDTLIGRGGHDVLTGGMGRDVLVGGDGNDSLAGFRGPDRLDAGAGDDHVLLPRFGRLPIGTVRCGPGRDLLELRASAVQPGACEGRELNGYEVWLERTGATVRRITLKRTWTRVTAWCRATVELAGARGVAAHARFGRQPLQRDQTRSLTAPVRVGTIRAVRLRRSRRCRGPLPGRGDPPALRWRIAAA